MATVLTQHQKFRKAKTTIEQLPALASEVGMVEFIERMNVLEQIRNIWARGGKVTVSKQSTSSNIAECEIGRFAFFRPNDALSVCLSL